MSLPLDHYRARFMRLLPQLPFLLVIAPPLIVLAIVATPYIFITEAYALLTSDQELE